MISRAAGRYIVVGGSVYGLELLIIVLVQRAGASAPLAVGLSFIIGTIVSFGLQKYVTFEDKRTERKVLSTQIAATTALIVWNLLFSVGLTALLEHHLPAIVLRTLALAITTIWNFYLYKTRIFNQTIVGIVD